MANVIDVKVDEIRLDHEFNCRGPIGPHNVVDLVRDIQTTSENMGDVCPTGLIQPITVTPLNPPIKKDDGGFYKYDVIAGFRRATAFKVLKRETIPATVIEGLNEQQKRILNLKENLKREQLNIMQEAKAIAHFKNAGWTEDAVMKELDVKRGWVQVRYMLLSLPEPIQKEASAGFITSTHIRDLYSLKDNIKRFEAVKIIKAAREKSESRQAVSIKTLRNKVAKRIRDRSELIKLQDRIQDYIGNNLATRILAWAAGEIDDMEVHQAIMEYSDLHGHHYIIPEFEN